MIPKKAIEKAQEGGWTNLDKCTFSLNSLMGNFSEPIDEAIALDPTFWQALGKALGWDERTTDFDVDEFYMTDVQEWEFNAHWFAHIVLTGGDTEAFWNDILK